MVLSHHRHQETSTPSFLFRSLFSSPSFFGRFTTGEHHSPLQTCETITHFGERLTTFAICGGDRGCQKYFTVLLTVTLMYGIDIRFVQSTSYIQRVPQSPFSTCSCSTYTETRNLKVFIQPRTPKMPTKRRLRTTAAVLMLHGCHAFVSNPFRTSLIQQGQQQHRRQQLTAKHAALPFPKKEGRRDEEQDIPSVSDHPSTTNGLPTILSTQSDDEKTSKESFDSSMKADVVVGPRGDAMLSLDQDEQRKEDIQAILLASERAVVEAEASIPPELIDQLGFGTSGIGATAPVGTSDKGRLALENTIPEIRTVASVVGEPVTTTKKVDPPPGISKIIKFAIPAIGVWLCGPLLSLIDTSAVGIFSGTIQQAALNPAVAVTDYSALLIVRISETTKKHDFRWVLFMVTS